MKSRRPRGFSLLELMVVIAIIAIIASIGLPAFNRQMQSNDVSADTNSMIAFLNYARSEAATSKQGVEVCSSSDSSTCAGNTDWNQAIIARQTTSGTVLKMLPSTTTNNTLTASQNAFTFKGDGSAAAGTIQICAPTNDIGSRRISVNGSGQTRTEVIACP